MGGGLGFLMVGGGLCFLMGWWWWLGWWLGFSYGGWWIGFSDGSGGGLDFLMVVVVAWLVDWVF